MSRFTVLLLLLCTVSLSILSQTVPLTALQQADTLAAHKEYAKAEQLYRDILKDAPGNNLAVFKLASLYYAEKKYSDAASEYLKLAPNKNPTVLYNLACVYSLMNNTAAAMAYLDSAVQNGFSQVSAMRNDPDLANIRGEKKFGEIARSIKALENFPEASMFDFWVGEWDVYSLQHQKAGESRIEKILNNTVILENWSGGNGYTGKSFNHFDMNKQKWIEYWIDITSSATYYEGNYDSTQHAIVFYSYDHAHDAAPYIQRLTFFNLGPNEVRQFSQRSSDGGKTWTVSYDLQYIRKGRK